MLFDTIRAMVAGSNEQSPHYSADSVFQTEFSIAQSPLRMTWTALAAGVAATPVSSPFRYCDLGCGTGSTLNLLAGCFPHASFVGIDIDPEHIAAARALAERAGLGNVSYIEASFDDLDGVDLEEFHFITTIGVYSWLPRTVRGAVHQFVQRWLRPDGLFAINYMAMPGAAASDLVASYVRMLSESSSGGTTARFKSGVSRLKRIAPLSSLFRNDPYLANWLLRLDSFPAQQLAHDFMNRRASSFYFRDMNRLFTSLGLSFCGSAKLAQNLPELQLPADQLTEFLEIVDNEDREYQESVLDLILHTNNRIDLYVYGNADRHSKLSSTDDIYLLRTARQSDAAARRRASEDFAADLASSVHAAILELCDHQAHSVSAVLQHDSVARFRPEEAERAIQQLCATRFLNILGSEPASSAYDSSDRYRFSSLLNKTVFEDQLTSIEPVHLASGVLGAPVDMPEAIRIRLHAFLGGDLSAVWKVFCERVRQQAPNARVASLEQFEDSIRASLPDFVARELPILVRLGLLERDS